MHATSQLASDATRARDFPRLRLQTFIDTSLLLSFNLPSYELSTISIPSFASMALPKKAGQGTNDITNGPVNPLSYPKSSAPFSAELFKNPTSEYRGCPFWAWNNKLDKTQLLRQIDYFEAMGMGGFHVSGLLMLMY